MPQAPAGWYPQPNGTHQYWDGSRWLALPAPAPRTMAPMVSAAPVAPARVTGLAARLGGWSTGVVALVAAAVGIPASIASMGVTMATASVFVASSETATVTKIVDGDTFDVTVADGTKRVRLLNVDTPESVKPGVGVQCLSLEATAALTTMMPVGSTVTLGYDYSRLDQYGRTLAGVTTSDGVLVNAELARLGLGLPVVVGNNRKYEPPVAKASLEAQKAQVGLFSPRTSCAVAAEVAKVEEATALVESGPAPTTQAQADSLAEQAAALAVLASALDARLRSGDAFEVVTLPAAVRKHYRDVATAATTRSSTVQASAKAQSAAFVRAAQEKAAAEATAKVQAAAQAQAQAQAAAQAKAAATAKAQSEAAARAAAAAAQKRGIVALPPKAATPTKPRAATPKATTKTTTKPRVTTPAPAKPSTSGCVIKGNISSSGEKIYHVPGGGSYNATKISPAKGERMFCSEAAAVAAGWRKARN